MAISCALPFEAPKTWHDKWINGQGHCIQGNHSEDTHKGDLCYAFDFKLRPGTKVLAARPGVVVALCSHFGEGGLKRSLRPRANFVALRHDDGTYTRYVHLLRGGVLVRLGQQVAAGQAIARSGGTGYTSGPHLHFDAVDILPQETSEVWLVHPEVVSLPSVAAIFSGPLHREVDDFVTAPLIYLSPDDLLASRSARSNGNRGTPKPDWMASQSPLLTGRSEVVVLIDRGGAGGDQAFAEAAATAAGAVATVLLPPRQGLFGGVYGGDSGGSGRCCRCVGVIVANDRPGHEVFPMANNGEKGMRAPYPVVMVSQESGQVLKNSISQTSLSPSANSSAIAGGVIVGLGAAQRCPARAAPAEAEATSACSSSTISPATSTSGADSYGEGDGEFEASRLTTSMSAGDGYGWAPPVVGYPFPHDSHGYEFGGSIGPPLSCYIYHSQSNAVAAAEFRSGARNVAEVGRSRRGDGRGVGDEDTGEWKWEEMLYRAKTLPVRFTQLIW
eukprot:g14880.t1